MHVVRRYVPLAAALAALLSAACFSEDPVETPTLEPIVNDSPVNCLRLTERSWVTGNFALFKPCLSPNFIFYFNPNDVGQTVEGYVIPVSWNRAEMLAAIRKMFNQAYGIEMDIPTNGVGTPGSGATTWPADNITITMVLYTEAGTGYRIGAGYCNFAFEKYDDEGKDRWRLTDWWDYTSESRDGSETSLGKVLTIFR